MLLSAVIHDRWRPGIGDPTVIGWVTVAAYFSTVLLCLLCTRYPDDRLHSRYHPYYRQFWRGVALIMALLGVNKQLDLQSLFTVIGRDVVQSSGFNDYKRMIQALFLLVLAISSIFIYKAAISRFSWCYHHYRLTFWGLGFLIVFILARASSFHHFDWFINVKILGIRTNWILELGGITCIAISAINQIRRMTTTNS
jgi:hypothetical protein